MYSGMKWWRNGRKHNSRESKPKTIDTVIISGSNCERNMYMYIHQTLKLVLAPVPVPWCTHWSCSLRCISISKQQQQKTKLNCIIRVNFPSFFFSTRNWQVFWFLFDVSNSEWESRMEERDYNATCPVITYLFSYMACSFNIHVIRVV